MLSSDICSACECGTTWAKRAMHIDTVLVCQTRQYHSFAQRRAVMEPSLCLPNKLNSLFCHPVYSTTLVCSLLDRNDQGGPAGLPRSHSFYRPLCIPADPTCGPINRQGSVNNASRQRAQTKMVANLDNHFVLDSQRTTSLDNV